MLDHDPVIRDALAYADYSDNYEVDRIEELKQGFLDEGDLLKALNELANGEQYAKEMYMLSKWWMEAIRENDTDRLIPIAVRVFAKISASMELMAEKWAKEKFEQENQNDGYPGFDMDERNEFRRAA